MMKPAEDLFNAATPSEDERSRLLSKMDVEMSQLYVQAPVVPKPGYMGDATGMTIRVNHNQWTETNCGGLLSGAIRKDDDGSIETVKYNLESKSWFLKELVLSEHTKINLDGSWAKTTFWSSDFFKDNVDFQYTGNRKCCSFYRPDGSLAVRVDYAKDGITRNRETVFHQNGTRNITYFGSFFGGKPVFDQQWKTK